ncbi:MAG: aspartate/glutamate racemase family protein [Tepidanaerobacteraceae bacterium]|jgi:glutamate racemase|nr:aspartate/glutamate racemase family protein [Tepidanaerobacteraceae bacterium]
MQRKKIGVIAGTPVDTRMGTDFIAKRGYEAIGVPTASCPEEQNLLQFLNPSALTEKVKDAIQNFEQNSIFSTIIYCNSLSSAIDVDNIKKTCNQSRVVTPLDAYAVMALRYKRIMIWAANGQCLSGIEKIFYEKNGLIEIIGVSMLPVIKAIEARMAPEKIIELLNLTGIFRERLCCEALVLGCTHLPYLKESLQKKISLPIIDPAEEILRILEEE